MKIVSADVLASARTSVNSHNVDVSCPHCIFPFNSPLKYSRGDSRIQALIIHEDRWSPHSTLARHSIAAVTITHACMTKADRCDANNAWVYSVNQLPNNAPHKYDAFFEPLLKEIEDLYVQGEEVLFKAEIEGISPSDDFPTLHVLQLLVTADSRAHLVIGLTTAGEYCGCKHCTVIGTYIQEKRHNYDGNFRCWFWLRSALRTAEDNKEKGRQVYEAPSTAERKRRQKEIGVTGWCIFYHLYDLCGLDPMKDMVIDAMHAVILNFLWSELENHLLADLCANKSRSIHLWDSSQGGVLDVKDLMKSLSGLTGLLSLQMGEFFY